MEPEVGHDRDGDAAAGEPPSVAHVQRRERDELVAVHDRAGPVDREDPIAVAVEREAGVVAALDDRRDDPLDVCRAAAGVDVASVGGVVDRGHRRAQAPEGLGGDPVGGAVRAVEDDFETPQIERREARVELAHVVLVGAVQRPHAPDRRRARARPLEPLLDRELGRV